MDITLIDTVRASREGHHFHEAWAAHLALTLLVPKDGLIGIAVEGLSPDDQADADDATAEIADLALYYGADANFADCDKQAILQLKYSIAKANAQLVASDMLKTLKKFSLSEAELLKAHGGTANLAKRSYRVVSNRPFGQHFLDAIQALRTGQKPTTDDVASQLKQIRKVLKLTAAQHAEFAKRLAFTGEEPNLRGLKNAMAIRLNRWSAGNDLHTAARLGGLDEMIRDKAESAGQGRNVVRRTDVLIALRLEEVEDLLPTPAAFPQVTRALKRQQGEDLLGRLHNHVRPLLVHATGGMGKTVLMQQLRDSMSARHEVILFDCFGGGAYRNTEDERHKLSRGLLHIVNQLALKGLCDPLLPGQMDDGTTLRTATKRLKDAATTLQQVSPGALLVLLLDGVDNAAQQAQDRNEKAFPNELLSFAKSEDWPPSMRLVVTCRTERRALLGPISHVDAVALQPFTQQETAAFIQGTLPDARPNDPAIAFARSGGNPRVLRYLTQHWPEQADSDHPQGIIPVEQLIQAHIQQAADLNHHPDYLDRFLAGLAVLPMPVPVDDYAAAYGITPAEARSLFVALSPLLEETQFGVIFRDEPTETWIRATYASREDVLSGLAACLEKLQGSSHFAGLALPHLLVVLRDVDGAVKLALDDSPASSPLDTIGGRRIRMARVQAALSLTLHDGRDPVLVRLLVEAGTLQHAAEKGSRYIADNSDLSAVLGDGDVLLQLFRYRTGNPTLRHARLTIAYLLAGAPEFAAHHANQTREWLRSRQANRTSGSDPDFADKAVAFYCLCQRDFEAFFTCTEHLSGQDTYSITVGVLSLARVLQDPGLLVELVGALRNAGTSSPGLLAGVLDTLHELPPDDESALLDQLASGITGTPIESLLNSFNGTLLDAALRAYRLGQLETSRTLHNACNITCPDARAFDRDAHGFDLPNWLLHCTLGALLRGNPPCLTDILPSPFREIAQAMANPGVEDIAEQWVPVEGSSEAEPETYASMLTTLRSRIAPMSSITRLCAAILSKPAGLNDEAAADLLALSETIRDEGVEGEYISASGSGLERLARALAFRVLRLSQSFSVANAYALAQALHARHHNAFETIDYVAFFANQPALHEVAGKMASRCVERIGHLRDLSSRRQAFAQLARAVLPASRDESHGLYREGLSLIDDVERSDNQFLSRVFALSHHLTSPVLDPVLASRFVSLSETGRPSQFGIHFPWLRFGQAAAAILGPRALLLIGRWDNDNFVKLSHALGPVLVGLLRQQVLDAVQALALLALETPEQWVDLRLDGVENRGSIDLGMIDALVARGDLTFNEVCEELIQRTELGWARSKKLPTLLLHALLGATREHSNDGGSARERVETLYDAQQAALASSALHLPYNARDTSTDPSLADAQQRLTEVVETTDPCDSASIQAAWTCLDRVPYLAPQMFFAHLRRKVGYAQQARHLLALSEVCAPRGELDALLDAVRDGLETGSATTAIKQIRSSLASKLIESNLPALVSELYALDNLLSKLAGLGPQPAKEIARHIVTVACERRIEVTPAAWLALSATLSQGLDSQDMSSIVSRLLDSPIAHLAEHDGIGKHRDWLAPTGNVDDYVAQLIYLKLGDSDPYSRAAATDAVVFLAKHQRLALLQTLVTLCNRGDVSTVNGGQAHFCFMNAHISLAIGLLRGLQSMQTHCVGPLLKQLLSTRQYHPFLRQLATQTDETLAETEVLNTPPWSVASAQASALVNEQNDEPTLLPTLANIFSLTPFEAAARVTAQIAQWAPTAAEGDSDIQQPEHEQNFAQHRLRRKKREFMAHLHWHAILVTGNTLADTRRSTSQPFDEPAWEALIRAAWEEYGIQWV